MPTPTSEAQRERLRNLRFLSCPAFWPQWPFLPLVRRRPGAAEECGLLCDLWRLSGRTGFSATVFLANLFLLPRDLEAFLALPRETYDTAEEVVAAGWRVD